MTTVTDTTISFDNATSKILDSNDGLGGFIIGDFIEVRGTTAGQNDTFHRVVTVAAGELVVTGTVVDELAGEDVTVESLIEYRQIQAAVLLIVRETSGLDQDHVSASDIRIIDQDDRPKAILFPGGIDYPEYGVRRAIREWEVMVELYEPNQAEDQKMWREFTDLRDLVIRKLELYPSLNSLGETYPAFAGVPGVTKARVRAVTRPDEIYDRDPGTGDYRGPYGIYQILAVTVMQWADLTGGEY